MTKQPSAKIICDSIGPNGVRLVTMELEMHRIILAELNTHRALSKCSASSRAVPTKKFIERVQKDPAMPLFWGSNKPGMQAGAELEGMELKKAKFIYRQARDFSVDVVISLAELGLHKQITNRLIEPWMWHKVIISGTDWDNFFYQRCSEFVQPEMKALADAMQLAYYTHSPTTLELGQFHLPYITQQDWEEAEKGIVAEYVADRKRAREEAQKQSREYTLDEHPLTSQSVRMLVQNQMKAISTARCARVSYLNHDGVRSLEDDLKMFNEKLVPGGHWTPFEHVAQPTEFNDRWFGNFKGWIQYRKEFSKENHTRFIPNLPQLMHIADKMRLEDLEKEEKNNVQQATTE